MFTELLHSWAINFDLPILDWIQATMKSDFMDFIMPLITVLGDAGIFWMLCGVAMVLTKKYRRAGFGVAIAMSMGLLICNVILKPAVGRIRPYDLQESMGVMIPLLIEKQHDFSFPSGHTIASFEAATVILLADKRLGIPAMILAILIAFSRLYLYVHYPTDVITSVFLGTLFGIIGYVISKNVTFSSKGKFLKK